MTVWSFVTARHHAQYLGCLSDEATARLVRQGRGRAGRCIDYLENTRAHLADLGIRDRRLNRILTMAADR